MSETKHTPGPWRAYPESDPLYVLAADGRALTQAFPDQSSVFLNPADAVLCAAAPDLLDALRTLMEVEGSSDAMQWSHARKAARRAIAKAEGRAQGKEG